MVKNSVAQHFAFYDHLKKSEKYFLFLIGRIFLENLRESSIKN